MIRTNLNGGAMIFALAILLLISILISLFLTLNLTYSKINKKHIDYNEGINLINEGFKLGYYMKIENYKGDMISGTENIEISKKLWGCYFRVSSTYKIDSNSTIAKVGLIGNQYNKDFSLYLADNNSKLSITGNTLIRGDCFLSEKGVGISYIEGKSFIKKKLIDGVVKRSKSNLPAINQFIIQDNLLKMNGVFNPIKDSMIEVSELANTSMKNSFETKTLVIKANSALLIDGSWNLSGNIIVYSPAKIRIKKGAKLDNVILYSNEIIIEKGVQICSQLIAKDYIKIDSNSVLTYPSSIFTIGDSSKIDLLGNSSMSGTMISFSKNFNAFNTISISKNASVTGLIYNTNKTELKGKIFGKLITKKLYHKSPSTVYSNTLIDAEINNSLLPEFYSFSPILKKNNSPINVIKWLK